VPATVGLAAACVAANGTLELDGCRLWGGVSGRSQDVLPEGWCQKYSRPDAASLTASQPSGKAGAAAELWRATESAVAMLASAPEAVAVADDADVAVDFVAATATDESMASAAAAVVVVAFGAALGNASVANSGGSH